MKRPQENSKAATSAWRAVLLLAFAAFAACGCGGGGGSSSGGGTAALAAPAVAVTSPAQDARVSDVDFLTTSAQETFEITIGYSGSSAMDFSTLSVTFSMDGGTAQDITAYFSKASETVIESQGLNEFTNTLFTLPENDEPSRTMTVNVSIRSFSGATAAATGSFEVVPAGAPGSPEQPPAPPAP